MSRYLKKQLFIGLVGVVIFVVIVGSVYLLIKPTPLKPNGEDNNQGLPKQPEVLLVNFIPTTENNYDLVARIKNPNINFGISTLSYVFELYDNADQIIGSRQGKTYILSQEAKYIVETKIALEKIPARVDLKINNVSFVKLENFQELDLKIKNREHQITADGLHRLVGTVENKTSYDIDTIEVVGILFGEDNKIIAVGRTEMNTVLMNESRGFIISWPSQILEPIVNFDVRVYANIFSSENLIK
jgi:hypothetical protein